MRSDGNLSLFKNLDQLLSTPNKDVRKDVLHVLEAAISSVDPYRCVIEHLKLEDCEWLVFDGNRCFLGDYENIYVVGGGKAAHTMAKAVVDILGEKAWGWLNGAVDTKIGRVVCTRAGHPIPDRRGEEGAKKILEIAEKAGENDLVLCLLSGGGSAMMPLPERGLSLEDKMETTRLLLACGADINEINAVRKHLSRIKGGKLAKAAYPATVVSLILSDVIGDPLDGIASGPTAPDTTTFEDAIKVLERYNILSKVPKSVRRFLEEKSVETPKPGDKIFERVFNLIVGNNEKALRGAEKKARELGYNTLVLSAYLNGEARKAPEKIFGIVGSVKLGSGPVQKPAMIIFGGETTVTLRGTGVGGRNQELALSSLKTISEGVTLAAIGTDGVDGVSPAAGAIADLDTLEKAGRLNLSISEYLDRNDSYHFFEKTGGLLVTGPTGTNVADIVVVAVV